MRQMQTFQSSPAKKKTDVNIATHLICDGIADLYETAIIVTADSDLIPAINAVKKLKPKSGLSSHSRQIDIQKNCKICPRQGLSLGAHVTQKRSSGHNKARWTGGHCQTG